MSLSEQSVLTLYEGKFVVFLLLKLLAAHGFSLFTNCGYSVKIEEEIVDHFAVTDTDQGNRG